MTSVTIAGTGDFAGTTIGPASPGLSALREATDAAARAKAAAANAGPGIDRDALVALMARHIPVTSNMLHSTKDWLKMCGGVTDTNVNFVTSHDNSGYDYQVRNGTLSGSIRIVSNIRFQQTNGLIPDGGVSRADNVFRGDLGDKLGDKYRSNFTDFNALVADVTLTATSSNKVPKLSMLRKTNIENYLSAAKAEGDFRVVSTGFLRCLAQSGEIEIVQDSEYIGMGSLPSDWRTVKEWAQYSAYQIGFFKNFQIQLEGEGRLKFALVLPYVGYGGHSDNFVWAGFNGDWAFQDRND